MSKRFLGAVAFAVGLTVVPVTLRWRDHAKAPTLALSEACAAKGDGKSCCISYGDLCLLGGELLPNYRTSLGEPCSTEPGF
jgi:hypothetical protein